MPCPLFLVSHSFLSHESSLSSSVSLICSVVVAIISLTLVLLNLIPLSLFSSVYNFSPLIPFSSSSSFFVCLWAPQGLFLVWFHPSFSTWWKCSQSPKAPGGHTPSHSCSESPQQHLHIIHAYQELRAAHLVLVLQNLILIHTHVWALLHPVFTHPPNLKPLYISFIYSMSRTAWLPDFSLILFYFLHFFPPRRWSFLL